MFTNPKKNIETLNLTDSMKVADLGAGTGVYSIEAAKKVPNGRVFAIEVQKELLKEIKKVVSEEGLDNVEVIQGDIERLQGTKLKDDSMDAVIVSNVLFQIEDKIEFAHEAYRILKKGGKVLIIDWKDSFKGMGPAPEFILSLDEARQLFETTDFVFEEKIHTEGRHYGFIMIK